VLHLAPKRRWAGQLFIRRKRAGQFSYSEEEGAGIGYPVVVALVGVSPGYLEKGGRGTWPRKVGGCATWLPGEGARAIWLPGGSRRAPWLPREGWA
jgi:hypothetical protein